MTGRYDLLISRVLALCAAITVLILGGLVYFLFRFDRNRKNSGKALAV
jgi:heme/copper-type cytochrome/quinol oxidase subunit 2